MTPKKVATKLFNDHIKSLPDSLSSIILDINAAKNAALVTADYCIELATELDQMQKVEFFKNVKKEIKKL